MKEMRADMGGAATVCSAALAIARLRLPINLVVVTPLCENLPGPSANKPGDIIYAMNGKSVEIDNTDAEGRLILSGLLSHSCYILTCFVDLNSSERCLVLHLNDLQATHFTRCRNTNRCNANSIGRGLYWSILGTLPLLSILNE